MDLRQIMQETRNEELVEEREREARAKNIIVHGFTETGDTNDDVNNNIKELFSILEIDASPESIPRLGNPNEQWK